MILAKKFWFWSAILLLLATLLGIISLTSLGRIWISARAATAHYEAMDEASAAAARVLWLRDSLRGPDSERYLGVEFYDPIRVDLLELNAKLEAAVRGADSDDGHQALAKSILSGFDAASKSAIAQESKDKKAMALAVAGKLDRVSQSLSEVTRLAPEASRRQTNVTSNRVQSSLWWMCLWLFVVLLLSTLVHYRQYRMLVKPLVGLRDNIRKSAANDFIEKVIADGEQEFQDVASYFNGLARDLVELYRTLEKKVVERSRALVRSERLASVGFLAAGVAHEINNPLSVISGYAELSARSIRKVLDGSVSHESSEAAAETEANALSSVLETQEIIREEAFRCREITNRLLSLARGGSDERELLAVDDVVRQVSVLTKGLKNYRDRAIQLDFESETPLNVMANRTEMKQVLLNLVVNALEASDLSGRSIQIGGRRDGAWVELFVQDQGKGMSAQTLSQIFEPFYTDKRGVGEAGTGLGLSITHAIVEAHGGTIAAHSDGPGQGSRFTIRLPWVKDRHITSTPRTLMQR